MNRLGANLKNIVIAILVLAIFLTNAFTKSRADIEIKTLLDQVEITNKDIALVKNSNITLKKAIKKLDQDKTQLLETIKSTKEKPAQIKYIVQTKTVLEASEPVYVTNELPANYEHKLDNDVVVASFESKENEYKFNTYDLSFRSITVVGRKNSATSFEISSSKNPETWKGVEVESTIIKTEQPVKFVEPNFGIALTAGTFGTEIMPGIYTSLLHPSKNIDLLGFYLAGNERNIKTGLLVSQVNVSPHVPFLKDVWLGAGVSVDLYSNPNVDLMITTKL